MFYRQSSRQEFLSSFLLELSQGYRATTSKQFTFYHYVPMDRRRRFNVNKMSHNVVRRRIDVETMSCVYKEVPRSSWYPFDRPRKDESLGINQWFWTRDWVRILDWASSALTYAIVQLCYNEDFLYNFAKLTEKHLRRNLFYNKVAGSALKLY